MLLYCSSGARAHVDGLATGLRARRRHRPVLLIRRECLLALLRGLALWQSIQNLRGRGSPAVLLYDLTEENGALPVNQECRRIGRLMGRVPPQAVQGRKLIPGIQYEIEIVRQFLVSQELVRFGAEILWWTGVDHN